MVMCEVICYVVYGVLRCDMWYKMWCHLMCHAILCSVIWCDVMMWCDDDVMWCEISCDVLCDVLSCDVMGYVMWWDYVMRCDWCAILIAHQIVMAKHGGSCVHFSGISTCGNLARDCFTSTASTVTNSVQNISLPVYVFVTNTRLQPLTRTFYNSMLASVSLLKIFTLLMISQRWFR